MMFDFVIAYAARVRAACKFYANFCARGNRWSGFGVPPEVVGELRIAVDDDRCCWLTTTTIASFPLAPAGGSGAGGGGVSGGTGGGGGDGGGGGGGGGGSGGGGGAGGGRGGAVQRGGFGGGQRQQQQRLGETPSPQQLREWYSQRGGSGGGGTCPYVIRTGDRTGQTCGRKNIDIFALDFDAILGAMYALTISVEGDCYLSVPPDPGIGTSETAPPGASASAALGLGEAAALGMRASPALGPGEAAALGASASALAGTTSTEALHTFTLDLGASRCFFRDRTALEQLARPVAASLADPSGGPVIVTSSTVLPCSAVPSGTLLGLYLPSFSTNLVAGSALQDGGVHQFTPAYERVTHCTCARTGRHLATFTRQPGSDLYTLTTESPQRLRGMHSRYLVSGLPRVLPPLPPSPAPPCLPCVEGQQRAAPHSSSFPPTEAPLQTLHLDVWGPARVRGQGHERYFLLVVDDYTRYTTVFPLRAKGEVSDVLIPWIRAARLQLRERFQSDFSVLRLHSDRGGEFSSDLLAAYCAEHGIRQTFTLPASPQQNGVAERRIGLVMQIAHTSLIHAAAPHFLWPFAVQYAAHQLNLWPRVSAPETSPTLLWTGQVGDASRYRVWGARAFIRDTTADKLSASAVPCVFLGFVLDAPGWQFYHPTSRRVFPSQDVTFDESVPFYRLFPYRTAPLPPPPLFLTPGAPPVDPLPPQGPAPSGVSQVDAVEPVEVAVDSGPVRGTEPWGTETGGAEPGGAATAGDETGGAETPGSETGGAEPGGAAPGGAAPLSAEIGGTAAGGAEPGGAEPGGAEPRGTEPGGVDPVGAPSSQQLREWYARRCSLRSGAPRFELPPAGGPAAPGGVSGAAGGTGAARGASGATGGLGAVGGAAGAARGTGAAGGATGAAVGTRATGGAAGTAGGTGAAAGATGGPGAAGAPSGAPGPGTGGAAEAGVIGGTGVDTPGGATGAAGVGVVAGGSGAVSAGSGGTSRPRPYFVPLLQQLQPASPLPSPSPYAGPTGGLTERRQPESRPVSPESRSASPVIAARPGRRVPRQRPPAVPGTHQMLLRLSTAPRRVPLPSPPASSLPALADPESDYLRAARPTVTRLLSTVVTDPSFESAAASALVTELVDFAAHCRLDYAAGLVAESESVCPPSVGGECALGTDVLEDRQEEFECFAAAVPHLVSMLIAPEGDPDAPDIPTPRSYAEAIAGEYSSQWQTAMDAEMASWKSTGSYVDEVPPPGANIVCGMWIFRVKRPPGSPPVFKARYVARGFSQREGVDFFQTFSPTPKMTTLRVLLHVAAQRDYELHSLDFSTAFLQGSLHEEIWLRRPPGFTGTTLAALGFSSSTADPSLFLRTDTSLPPFYILVYVDDLVFATADTEALAHVKLELQKRHTCTDLEPSGPYPELVGCLITSSMGLVLGGRRSVVLTGHSDASWVDDQATQRSSQGYTFSLGSAMAAQELRWLTYLLTDLGERPSSPPVLYLQQRGQLCLRYVATRANTADIFTKALQPGDHQRFCTVLGLVPTVPHLL
ncbi:unnamed protein product [Closterium sp. NIES-53]